MLICEFWVGFRTRTIKWNVIDFEFWESQSLFAFEGWWLIWHIAGNDNVFEKDVEKWEEIRSLHACVLFYTKYTVMTWCQLVQFRRIVQRINVKENEWEEELSGLSVDVFSRCVLLDVQGVCLCSPSIQCCLWEYCKVLKSNLSRQADVLLSLLLICSARYLTNFILQILRFDCTSADAVLHIVYQIITEISKLYQRKKPNLWALLVSPWLECLKYSSFCILNGINTEQAYVNKSRQNRSCTQFLSLNTF